jgi:hypothetical protein
MGTCCCGDLGRSRTVVVMGSSGSGVTTLVRRLRSPLCCGPRAPVAGSTVTPERWTHRPLPSLSVDASPVKLRHAGHNYRFVDAGPCTVPSPPSRPGSSPRQCSRDLEPWLSIAHAIVIVLDASRTLDEQGARCLAQFVRTRAASRPIAVLLSKYDTATHDTLGQFLTPTQASDFLALRDQKAPWIAHPCVISHRGLDLTPLFTFFHDPRGSLGFDTRPRVMPSPQNPPPAVRSTALSNGTVSDYFPLDRAAAAPLSEAASRTAVPAAHPSKPSRGYQRLARH